MQSQGGAALTQQRSRRLTPLVLILAVAVIVLDQISKILIVTQMADRDPIELVGGALTITYTRNSGAAFSIGTGMTIVFTLLAVVIAVLIVRYSSRLGSRLWAVVLGLILGGALGNLIDRIFRSPGFGRGHVVDWIGFPHFPVFNLADSAITCGAVLAIIVALLGYQFDGTREARSQ